jgi:ABC-type ATPase involved in cell division
MAKQAATTKQTGGGGYSFEDKVAARYLTLMLAGRPPLDERVGTIQQVKFQNRTDGWLLDDLLLRLSGPAGECRFALSIKSNQQITSSGFPADFVTAAWEQWLHRGTEVFDRARDYLGLVVGPLPQSVRTGWHGLLEKVVNADPPSALTRLSTAGASNEVERQLFRSLACNLPDEATSEDEIVRLVKRLRVLAFDFEETPSEDQEAAVTICQTVLESQSRAEAIDLWNALLGIAREYSPTGGSLNLAELIGLLRPKFRLEEYPEFATDFRRLGAFGASLIDELPDRIGGVAAIDRSSEIGEIISLLQERRALALLGPSGCGKSVLCKGVARTLPEGGQILCLDPQTLDVATVADLERRIGLHHALPRLIEHVSSRSAVLILDGIDRFSPDALRNAAGIVKALRLEDPDGPWRLILSCQAEEWERVARALLRQGIAPTLFLAKHLAPPPDDRLREVCSRIPSLTALTRRRELWPLLRNLKILDIVASNAGLAGNFDATRWVGESDLVRWFWQDIVAEGQAGLARSRLLQMLGDHEADHLRPTIALTDLDDSEARTLGDLVTSRICRARDDQVGFAHDLFGDWSRQRRLLAERGRLREFLAARIARPRWLRAIRLYGLDLLEQGAGDLSAWREAIEEVRPAPGQYDLATDLLLESVVFAANPLPILEAMWPDLEASQGELLRRLLRRFLHAATMPNPQVLAILGDDDEEVSTFSATMQRVPYWPYWLPMLYFLKARAESVVALAPGEVAAVADTWLRRGGPQWPLRQEAATLALAVARNYLDETGDKWYRRADEMAEVVYSALLAASYVRPDEVSPLVLSLCKRTPAREGEEPEDDVEELSGPPWRPGPFVLPSAWPDGPRKRVNEAFQEVCLQPETLVPLIETRPELAREVLLALLIRHPVPAHDFGWDVLDRDLGVEEIHSWYPAMYFRGPFRHFLSLQPAHGLDAIIRLVYFATDRWAERVERRGHEAPRVTICLDEREQVLIGDLDVYYWYRDRAVRSHPIACALMALERWLYDKAERNEPVDEWVGQILARSRSVALAGVLNALGRKHPELYEGPLRPLLGVWQFYEWELLYTAQRGDRVLGITLMSWTSYGESVFNAVRDWHDLPHRKQSLPEVAFRLLLSSAKLRPFFLEVRGRWEAELARLREQHPDRDFPYLEKLIAEFDLENWRAKEHPKGVLLEFSAPEEMRKKREPELERNQRQLHLMTFPFRCREILDKGEALSEEQLEGFWLELVQVAEGFVESEEEEEGPRAYRLHDIVCGGIAVLVCLHPEWLDARPERREWCDEWLARIIAEPPPPDPIDFEGSLFDRHWDSFLANIAAAEWARQPEAPEIRAFAASMAMAFRYETAGILMREVARYRDRLGADFERLQVLIVLWAAIRNIWNYSRPFEASWAGVDRWIGRLARAFAERRLPTRIPSWERVARASNHQVALMQLRRAAGLEPGRRLQRSECLARTRGKPGLDLDLLRHAFGWLPRLSEASSPGERSCWVEIHRQLLGVTIRRAAAKVERRDDNHLPNDFDRWVLDRVARLILELRPEESPESFWKPILELGPESHRWIEDFLSSWFMEGLPAAGSLVDFASNWRAMIEHAIASPRWERTSGRSTYDACAMWTALLGFGSVGRMREEAEYRAAITPLVPLYREWAARWLGYHDTARRFAHFLRQPASADILPEGLAWLFSLAQQYSDKDWDARPRDADAFVSLIEHWWRSRGRSRAPAEETSTAVRLLKLLSDRQHPRALELQDRMAKGT